MTELRQRHVQDTCQYAEYCVVFSYELVEWVTVVKFRVNDEAGDGTGSFEVKGRSNTTKLTDVRLATFGQGIC